MLSLVITARRSIHASPILLAAVMIPLASQVCLAGESRVRTEAAAAGESSHGFSFRPHPLPGCRSFAVLDLGVAYRLNEGMGFLASDNRGCGSLDLGYMRNLSRENAVGFSAFGQSDERAERGGIRGRYRRWLSPRFGLDATAGMTLAKSGRDAYRIEVPGVIASVGFQASGVVGVTLEAEQIRFPGGTSDWDWRIGGRLGSGAGVAASLVLLALGALYVINS
jgi:hypothetical protein